jgi:hypothetical protein
MAWAYVKLINMEGFVVQTYTCQQKQRFSFQWHGKSSMVQVEL